MPSNRGIKTRDVKNDAVPARRRAKRPLRLQWVEAGSLSDNPHNWRRHPAGQMDALKATLDEVGWAGALLFNQTTGRLIDGHARKAAVDPATIVPVLVGHWTEDQERRLLVSLDPLGSMAVADGDALEELLAEVDLSDDRLAELAAHLDELAEASDDGAAAVSPESPAVEGEPAARKRGERTALFVVGHLKWEIPRADFDRWVEAIEQKVGNDPDRVVREIKRRLKL